MEKNELRNKLLNDSGFLLQLAVERELEKLTYGVRPIFTSVVPEYPWLDPASNKGFIDIVATQRSKSPLILRFVIECKRVDCDWIFVANPTQESPQMGRFQWIKTKITPNSFPHRIWGDCCEFPLVNRMCRSEFCVVQGQDKEKPLLERICANLLQSVEGLASEDVKTATGQVPENIDVIYIPVIVTTASLVCSPIDRETISLSHGKINEAQFENMPAVHFRKSLAAETARRAESLSLRLSKRGRERSVIVVNSEKVTEILSSFRINWTLLLDDQPQNRLPLAIPSD